MVERILLTVFEQISLRCSTAAINFIPALSGATGPVSKCETLFTYGNFYIYRGGAGISKVVRPLEMKGYSCMCTWGWGWDGLQQAMCMRQ